MIYWKKTDMILKIKRKIIRKIFSYFFKRKKFKTIVRLSDKYMLNTEGYWTAQQLLNRGYLNNASEVIKNVSYKKEFDTLIRRIESMIEIRDNGLKINKIQKKNITHINALFCVHNSLPYDKAGYAIRTEHIVNTLKKQGLTFKVVTRPGYPWDLKKHRENLHKGVYDELNDIDYIRLEDSEKKFKRGVDTDYINMYAYELEKVAIQNDTSVIHAHSNYFNALSAIEAANRLKIPSVYEVRGLWHMTRLTLDANYRYAGMFTYEEAMEIGAMHASDAVVTISQSLKSLIVSWGINASKIHIIPNTIDTTHFIPMRRSEKLVEKYKLEGKTVIGFIGTLSNYEGLKELICAVDELIEEGLNIVLMIVGDGREKENLENSAKSEHIIFTGRVAFEEVKEYYTLLDICPFPRNNVEICQYVPPLKILEAMAMEKAVIVSNVVPLCEIIDDGVNGLVCETDNVESLKEKIVQLHHDISLRETLGKNSRVWVGENRSLEDMSLRYMALYNSFKDDHV